MKINKIKLAGFKSFVDPTTLQLPNQLTGIVGPNGCGKSNVIDAVLWVLGESSAKQLRGDNMSDVIFSGSNSRKPVGQASVEIIFDNSDGKITGEFASYNEISIKRTLGRDGLSLYHLNGNRCRRKDVTNLFLGTGIGPRSYSVITQGMISRVIESKPEELRVFLEEAAGISKYKERRRETENRIRHTKENLDRLNDIRDELDKQLTRLTRQAAAAERYKDLKQDERQKQAELLAFEWQKLKQQADGHATQTTQCETEVEAAIAKVRTVESEIEKQHQTQIEANDTFNEIQGRFYSIGADISRMEQAIQHANERKQTLERDKQRLERELAELEQQADQDRQHLQETVESLTEIEPELEGLKEGETELGEKLAEAECALENWQQEWNQFQQRQSEHMRNEHSEQGRVTQLERSLNNIEQRVERLNSEKNGIVPEQLGINLTGLQSNVQDAETLCSTLEARRTEIQQQIQQVREEVQQHSRTLDEKRREFQASRGRLASLEALQQAALKQDQQSVQQLLKENGLESRPKLAQQVSIDTGWETALEIVLTDHLDALCIDDLAAFGAQIGHIREGVIGGIENHPLKQAMPRSECAPRLLEYVKTDLPLEGLIGGVYVADSVDAALNKRDQLMAHESFVTPTGDVIGPNWLRLHRSKEAETGVIHREREIRELSALAEELEAGIDSLNEALETQRARRTELENEGTDLSRELDAAQKRRASLGSELAAGEARLEQARSRITHIENELQELLETRELETEELELVRERISGFNLVSEEISQQQDVLTRQREEQNARIQELRQSWRQSREQAHELALKGEALRARKNALEQSQQRHEMQQAQIRQRLEETQMHMEEGQSPIMEMQTELETTLAQRVTVETELNSSREALQLVEQAMRNGEQERQQNERNLQSAREKLEKARMEAQTAIVKLEGIVSQLAEQQHQAENLIQNLPEGASEAAWREELASLERKITRLGPINLAAIDECKELSERKTYLDEQHVDLSEAMETLENAIRKIDKETRTRFKEIYDQVNTGFQAMFPRLFGGGQAHLELTGEDLLETGVSVIAKPPGKRNSSIQLLSGGEKALTAVALVFSIFQLNPAPFCLLDEVDAPLDDANVVRLCDMLKHMSEQVQFLYISHNKITMEIAQQLIGVTMHEPGVSRLVAVDMDEAVSLASA